jgi:hypothetical protein
MSDPIVAALMVEAMAYQARVEGMKAENAARAARNEAPAYTEAQFDAESASLFHIAAALRNRA